MSALDISSRLETLRTKQAATPLATFLLIYSKAERECYMNYMEGMRLLATYLSPISFPEEPERRVPDILCSYETQELAKHLDTSQDIIIHTLIDMQKEGRI